MIVVVVGAEAVTAIARLLVSRLLTAPRRSSRNNVRFAAPSSPVGDPSVEHGRARGLRPGGRSRRQRRGARTRRSSPGPPFSPASAASVRCGRGDGATRGVPSRLSASRTSSSSTSSSARSRSSSSSEAARASATAARARARDPEQRDRVQRPGGARASPRRSRGGRADDRAERTPPSWRSPVPWTGISSPRPDDGPRRTRPSGGRRGRSPPPAPSLRGRAAAEHPGTGRGSARRSAPCSAVAAAAGRVRLTRKSASSRLSAVLKRRSKPIVVDAFELIAAPQSEPATWPGKTSTPSPSSASQAQAVEQTFGSLLRLDREIPQACVADEERVSR